MSSTLTTPGTTYSTTNWAEYQKGRPAYPPSLTSLITSYHSRNAAARWDCLVDVGAGSGIASLNFMSDFKIVHISDPSPSNEEQARPFLSEYVAQHDLHTQLEYSQSTGEEAWRETGEGVADMVISATAAHFMDPDGLSESIGRILKPGGTLAVYSYWMPTFPEHSKRLHDAFAETLASLILKPALGEGGEKAKAMLTKVITRRMTGKGGLDSLPLLEDVWENVKRVYINSPGEEIPYRELSKQLSLDKEMLNKGTRVGGSDEILNFESGVDAEAEGWGFEADKGQISAFLDSVRPFGDKMDEGEYRRIYGEWEKVFDEECPSGNVRIAWPVYVALATKKE